MEIDSNGHAKSHRVALGHELSIETERHKSLTVIRQIVQNVREGVLFFKHTHSK